MKNIMSKFSKLSQSSSVIASISAIVVGLVFGLIILLVSNSAEAFVGFATILTGGVSNGAKGLAQVINIATPIILTGLSVGFAFKTGLFNIGASGQLIIGGYVAILIGVTMPQLGGAHWAVALLGAIIAGGLWGLIPGILKAYLNVNEVISSIMMNYIGMYTANMLVKKTVFDKMFNQSKPPAETAIIPNWGLSSFFEGAKVNGGILIAIIVVIIIYIVLYKTTFGYELIACGHNPDASKYAGINAKKNIVLSMVIAGALAGLAGGTMYLAGTGKHIEIIDVLATEGFNGIPVALLGLSNPIGILFSALFIAYITVGGFYLQQYAFVPEVINIIIASIIYFSAFSLVIKRVLGQMSKKKALQKLEVNEKALKQPENQEDN